MCIGGLSSCTLVLTAHICGCPDAALISRTTGDRLEVAVALTSNTGGQKMASQLAKDRYVKM